jgi:hypothetical protein
LENVPKILTGDFEFEVGYKVESTYGNNANTYVGTKLKVRSLTFQ